jgi:hypothetical protein
LKILVGNMMTRKLLVFKTGPAKTGLYNPPLPILPMKK